MFFLFFRTYKNPYQREIRNKNHPHGRTFDAVMKRLLQQPSRQRYRYNPDLTRPFARHLGRRLSARERTIITFLERARLAGSGHLRAQVIDTNPTTSSAPLLLQYLQYLQQAPQAQRCGDIPVATRRRQPQREYGAAGLSQVNKITIITKTKTAIPAKGEATIVPFRRPNNLRGRDITHAVILDAHTHRRIDETLQAILGTLPIANTSGTACIIHSRRAIPLPRAYLPTDDTAPPPPPVIEDLSATADVILIDLAPHEPPPQPSPHPDHPQQDDKEKRRITRQLSPHIRPLLTTTAKSSLTY